MRIAFPIQTTMPLRRLGINSLRLLLARVSAQGLSLLLIALIARQLGATALGEYTLVLSIVFLANVATTFGTDSLLIRELGQSRAVNSELVSGAFWLQVGLSMLFIVWVFVSNGGTPVLPLYSLSLLPLAAYSVCSAVLRGFERMDLFLLLNLAASALQLVFALIVLRAGGDLTALLGASVVAQALTAVLAWKLARPYARSFRAIKQVPHFFRAALYASLPFALLTTSAVIYQRMGIFTLGALAGNQATGWFSAAARIVDTLKIAPQALLGALLPMMSNRALRTSASGLYGMSMKLLVTSGLLAALFLTVFAAPLINAIYGYGFVPAVSALSILAWGLVPFAVTSNLAVQMVAEGHEWVVLGGTLFAVVVALFLFSFLVPIYGLTGACWAAVLGEVSQAGLFCVLRMRARR